MTLAFGHTNTHVSERLEVGPDCSAGWEIAARRGD
jgi:hypothetical protein